MLFWLFIISLIFGIILYEVGFELLGEIISIIFGVAVIISIVILVGQYVTIDAYLEENKETYNAITYKVESDACRDEFGLLNKEVIDEIQEWNKNVVFYKSIQKNFWVGIYYPNVFDEFEKIDYEKYKNGQQKICFKAIRRRIKKGVTEFVRTKIMIYSFLHNGETKKDQM